MQTLRRVLLGLSLAGVCWGQLQTGLTGTVTDSTHAVVTGAKVTLRNLNTGDVREGDTNTSGIYSFPVLAAGEYEVSCEAPGFKKYLQRSVTLETGFLRRIDIELQVGALTESVEVASVAPLLEAESSTVGQFIERQTVYNMPLESRRSAGLVRLMGNVVFLQTQTVASQPVFSMSGGRSVNQMWALDGTSGQNVTMSVQQTTLNPPAESVQEFKAEENNYAAEYGRTGGGYIVITTRSGTNTFHGAAYEFFRNQSLAARTFFSRVKPPLVYNIFGASLGGPVTKDRTFFFVNYEGARRREGLTYNDVVPNPPEINGDFSARRDLVLRNPLDNQPFQNNIIPASRIDPVGQRVAQLYPAPNAPSPASAAPRNNFINSGSNQTTQDWLTAKVDHNFRASDRLFVRFIFNRAPGTTTAVFPNAFADPRGQDQQNQETNTTGNWIHNISNTTIQEVRVNFGRRKFVLTEFGTGSGQNGKVGIKGVDPNFFATFDVNGLSSLGTTTHERIQTPIDTWQFLDQYSVAKGKHLIKFGGEYRFGLNVDLFNGYKGGHFTFDNRATGSGLAELLLGNVATGEVQAIVPLASRSDYYGVFLQDNWKITPKLTLNLGFRWELNQPRWERNNYQSGFNRTVLNPVSNTLGVVTFAGVNGVSKYAHDFDKDDFGPRFGFAYNLGKGFVMRGGYGISYYNAYQVRVTFAMKAGFGTSTTFNSPDGNITPAFQLQNGVPTIVNAPHDASFGAVPVGSRVILSPDFLQQDQPDPMAQQWNFGIQKQLSNNSVLELTYVANVAHRLGGPDVDINMIPLVNGRGPSTQSQTARPFPQFGNVMQISPPWGNSTYHAMNFKVEKRYSAGLNLLANFTWSKFIDDVAANSELGGAAGNVSYTHIALRKLDKALSGNNIGRRLVTSVVYDLPWGSGRQYPIKNPLVNGVLGGWGLGLIAEIRDGAPFGVVENTNLSNTFSASQRPNLLGAPAQSPGWRSNVLAVPYFDITQFQAPGAAVFGNAPRTMCCGPGFVGVDLSAHKWWQLHERFKLQLRGDFYNVPNRPEFANPNLRRGLSNFGLVTGVVVGSNARLAQLSMRLEF